MDEVPWGTNGEKVDTSRRVEKGETTKNRTVGTATGLRGTRTAATGMEKVDVAVGVASVGRESSANSRVDGWDEKERKFSRAPGQSVCCLLGVGGQRKMQRRGWAW